MIDVGLRDGRAVEQLRYMLSPFRVPPVPIVAILRADTHQEGIQAAALGATIIFRPDVSVAEIAAALAPTSGQTVAPIVPSESLMATPGIEKARLQFETLFSGIAQGEHVDRSLVEDVTETILVAVVDSSIRQWLEVAWTYHDATYQHCLLVTGLAAAFAVDLDSRRATSDNSLKARSCTTSVRQRSRSPF